MCIPYLLDGIFCRCLSSRFHLWHSLGDRSIDENGVLHQDSSDPSDILCGKSVAWIVLETPKCWRCQSFEISAGEKAADREWSKPKRQKCVAVCKAGRGEPSEPSGSRHGVRRSEVFPAGFQACLGPAFPCYTSVLSSWKDNVQSVPLCVRRT